MLLLWRASMRGKYDQVNDFLKVVAETLGEASGDTFTVVDCGCGKAYLTLALYFYLTEVKGFADVKVIGVDRRADVIAAAKKMAAGEVTDGFTPAPRPAAGPEYIDGHIVYDCREPHPEDRFGGRGKPPAPQPDTLLYQGMTFFYDRNKRDGNT